MNDFIIKNLSVGFKDKPLLSDINLTIPKGKLVSIIGSNGVGKSTFLNIVGGLDQASSGEV